MNRNNLLIAFLIGGGVIALIFLGVLGVVGYVVYGRLNTPDGRYNRANRQGNYYYARREYNEALAEYTKMIEARPDLGNGYFFRAMAEDNLHRLNDAIADYKQAISRETYAPQIAAAYYNVGLCYKEKHKWKEAVTNFNTAAKGGEDSEDLYYNRAVCYDNLARYTESDKDYSRAVAADPDNMETRNERCVERIKARNYRGAEEDCRAMIRIAPRSSAGWGELGWVQYVEGRYSDSIASSKKAWEQDRSAFYAGYNLALAYAVTGNSNAAHAQYALMRKVSSQAEMLAGIKDLQDALKKQPGSALLKGEIAYLQQATPKR